jgi:hypothetical protein
MVKIDRAKLTESVTCTHNSDIESLKYVPKTMVLNIKSLSCCHEDKGNCMILL